MLCQFDVGVTHLIRYSLVGGSSPSEDVAFILPHSTGVPTAGRALRDRASRCRHLPREPDASCSVLRPQVPHAAIRHRCSHARSRARRISLQLYIQMLFPHVRPPPPAHSSARAQIPHLRARADPAPPRTRRSRTSTRTQIPHLRSAAYPDSCHAPPNPLFSCLTGR